MINVHGLRRNVKNVVRNYSDAQVKVREATSNDPWGPSGTLMGEIADLTYNVVAFSEIMQVVWKRLNDHGKNWKHVYKALVLLEYLLKTGSEKVTQQCKENIFAIQTLKDFQYFEESKDQGVNVREKAKQLVSLLKDDERLKGERGRALKARERFARSSSSTLARQEQALPRHFGSSEFSQGSCDEDMLSPTALSEFEQARPQTAGEEELQLQLALAMSKEEADQVERLKRNDDLRLQMALSESEEEFKKKDPPTPASAMEDLLGLSLPNARTPMIDPWGMPMTHLTESNVLDPWNSPNLIPEPNLNMIRNDPWSPSSETTQEDSSAEFLAADDNTKSSFDMSCMRKSVSADVCTQDSGAGAAAKSLDALLSTESNLIQLEAAPRSRTIGNPFQAARPSPMTMNEIRAQTVGGNNAPQQLPPSRSMPLAPSNSTLFTTVNRNPFM